MNQLCRVHPAAFSVHQKGILNWASEPEVKKKKKKKVSQYDSKNVCWWLMTGCVRETREAEAEESKILTLLRWEKTSQPLLSSLSINHWIGVTWLGKPLHSIAQRKGQLSHFFLKRKEKQQKQQYSKRVFSKVFDKFAYR